MTIKPGHKTTADIAYSLRSEYAGLQADRVKLLEEISNDTYCVSSFQVEALIDIDAKRQVIATMMRLAFGAVSDDLTFAETVAKLTDHLERAVEHIGGGSTSQASNIMDASKHNFTMKHYVEYRHALRAIEKGNR